MKVIQIVPTLALGDAIGNDTMALKKVIAQMGYKTEIYAHSFASSSAQKQGRQIKHLPKLHKEDVVIYHLAIGCYLNYLVAKLKCRKIIIYHNVTPPHFFESIDKNNFKCCNEGLKGVAYLSDKADYFLADSDFNREELLAQGYKCPVDVLPILIPFDDYEKEPDQDIIDQYSDGATNIIFTGRIAPNKKHEDVIKAFYCYKKYYDHTARLFLVGSFGENDVYYNKLKKYVKWLGARDVYFTGHIKFNQILAYYRIADQFLCMSEHEGFCVPLVEAMFFNVPIIAYDSTAIPYTLGGSGLLIKDKDPMMTAGLINRLQTDANLRKMVIANQRERLKDFSYEKIKRQFETYLKNFIQ